MRNEQKKISISLMSGAEASNNFETASDIMWGNS